MAKKFSLLLMVSLFKGYACNWENLVTTLLSPTQQKDKDCLDRLETISTAYIIKNLYGIYHRPFIKPNQPYTLLPQQTISEIHAFLPGIENFLRGKQEQEPNCMIDFYCPFFPSDSCSNLRPPLKPGFWLWEPHARCLRILWFYADVLFSLVNWSDPSTQQWMVSQFKASDPSSSHPRPYLSPQLKSCWQSQDPSDGEGIAFFYIFGIKSMKDSLFSELREIKVEELPFIGAIAYDLLITGRQKNLISQNKNMDFLDPSVQEMDYALIREKEKKIVEQNSKNLTILKKLKVYLLFKDESTYSNRLDPYLNGFLDDQSEIGSLEKIEAQLERTMAQEIREAIIYPTRYAKKLQFIQLMTDEPSLKKEISEFLKLLNPKWDEFSCKWDNPFGYFFFCPPERRLQALVKLRPYLNVPKDYEQKTQFISDFLEKEPSNPLYFDQLYARMAEDLTLKRLGFHERPAQLLLSLYDERYSLADLKNQINGASSSEEKVQLIQDHFQKIFELDSHQALSILEKYVTHGLGLAYLSELKKFNKEFIPLPKDSPVRKILGIDSKKLRFLQTDEGPVMIQPQLKHQDVP